MRLTRNAVLIAGALAFAACGRGGDVPPPDKLTDLTWMDTLTFPAAVASPLELGLVEEEPEPEVVAPAPRVAPRQTAPRQASAPRPASYPTASYPAPSYPAPAPQRTESNAKRDAAIGAAGGAVIGATVAGSGNRVRGAIIGGAAGAVLGGVIGHTVDRKKVPNP
ncbi:MAG TPA: glycine zipper 2TM domain-containing protein [Longimicrobiales bacterium]|nr:glycine zipper 2TM domain-containing protein [Longimicrobiales bacterium]